MPRKPRIHYTETDKALMWDRWRKGESLESIAQLFDRTHGSVARILRRTGGIRPPKRTRSRRTLSLAEREEISRGVVAGRSLRSIAISLCRSPSTVSREINRNGGKLADRLARYTKLVVLDELGYLPFSKNGGQLVFHLLSHLTPSTSLTCPDPGQRWGKANLSQNATAVTGKVT